MDNLRKICHISTNENGDNFVGIKVDKNGIFVHFPLGYDLPTSNNEQVLRRDIVNLISVISEYRQSSKFAEENFTAQNSNFPVNAYITLITDFLQRSYYTETEQKYTTSTAGKIHWNRTIRKHKPLLQSDGSPVYTQFETRQFASNTQNLITQIHEFCVFAAFQKLGWLFSAEMPRKPQLRLNKPLFASVIRQKLNQTFNDTDKRLFISMLDILDCADANTNYSFGTENFEHIWEYMVDKIFGIADKSRYFPRTYWQLTNTENPTKNHSLRPDTIMISEKNGEKYAFILDAKYYKYGITANPRHLPETSDIHKQITYGEFVHNLEEFAAVFNVFVMPYNAACNLFEIGENARNIENTKYIGTAYSDWKIAGFTYEIVHGVLIDVKCLMLGNFSVLTSDYLIGKILEQPKNFAFKEIQRC
ncbi:MAG: LlaJI family restriction endonuclease [Firmicutes bacterium]|nr:LlaJI family restriction endonuclease [Bacillota bacterium]